MARRDLAAVLVTIFGMSLSAQGQRAPQHSEVSFTVSGTSTVRSWSCSARGTIKVAPGKAAQPALGFPSGVQAVTVTVPLSAFECENPETTEHLRDALKAKAHPEITYQLEQYALAGSDVAKATGRIRITAVSKPIAFDVKLTSSSDGVRGVGETSIDMTEFGIAPPSLWGNLLRVGKVVRVKFDALLRP